MFVATNVFGDEGVIGGGGKGKIFVVFQPESPHT